MLYMHLLLSNRRIYFTVTYFLKIGALDKNRKAYTRSVVEF